MAKKKKIRNVQISTEELKPTTIGYLNSRQKGSFLLIFIFAVLFATLYFMSDITEFINKIINPSLYAEMQEAKKELNEDNTGVIVELSASTHFNISGVKFSNFVVEGNQLKFKVDASAGTGDFSDYYMETYDRSSELLERFLIADTSISSFNLNFTNVRALSISYYEKDTYPNTPLKDSTLTCNSNSDSYKYEFTNGGVSKISYTITIKQTPDNISKYSELLEKYTIDQNTVEEGVEKYLTDNETEFTFTKEVDLLVAKKNNLDHGYNYNTKVNQIAFEMSTKGYKCN